MFGRFLYGVFSGTALVACGFVVAAALFPLEPPAVIATSGEAAPVNPDPVDPAPIAPEDATAEAAPLPEAGDESPASTPPQPEPAPPAPPNRGNG